MLNVALKEWAIVCDLLLEGELALLLRKGGIAEAGGPGEFELEHPRFLLYPSWAHQRPAMIKQHYRSRVEVTEEPGEITFQGLANAVRIWQVPSREAFDQLEHLHCWTKPQIDMRFLYRPDRPLYLMAVRAYRLARPKTVVNDPVYAGCRSWVPLRDEDAVDDAGAQPAMEDAAFGAVVTEVDDVMTQER
jgi:hypothetical protein